MKTLILQKPGRLTLGESPPPARPGPGEAVVRVRRVGICGTDIHAYRGDQPYFSYPRILGHELGVEITDLGENEKGLKIGDRCAVEPYLDCGRCIACRRGRPNCCVSLQVLGVHTDGGMREYITVPVEKLHRSERLSLEQLALVETLTIGAHAVARAALESGEWVLVIGAGPIGLGVIRFAQIAGARVMVTDLSDERLEFARKHFGVEFTLRGGENPEKQVKEITEGDFPSAVFDATGSAPSMSSALRYVAHSGRLIFVGLVQADVSFSDPEFHRKEATLLSSRNATAAEFQQVLTLMEAGTLDPSVWTTHRALCTNLVEEFPRWVEPGAGLLKGLVEF